MSSIGTEARVGIFVLTAVTLLVGFLLALGDVRLSPGFKLYADFAFAGGLQTGAPIRLSGIRIGQVIDLHFVDSGSKPPPARPTGGLGQSEPVQVRATLALDAHARQVLRQDISFAVATQGLIGETYLELQPGGGTGAAPLAEAEAVRGVDAPRLHVIELQLSSIMTTVGSLLGATGGETGELGHAIAALVGTVNGVLTDRRAQLIDAITNVAAASDDLHGLLSALRTGLGGGEDLRGLMSGSRGTVETLRGQLPSLLSKAQTALQSLQTLSDKANASVDAPVLAATLKDARSAAQHLEALTADAQTVLRTVRRGEGTLGALASDPEVFDDIKELLRDLKSHPWKFLWRD